MRSDTKCKCQTYNNKKRNSAHDKVVVLYRSQILSRPLGTIFKKREMQTNKLITVLLLALSLKSFAQLEKVKGDGLVSISLDSLPIIEFYETKESIAPIRMVKVTMMKKLNLSILKTLMKLVMNGSNQFISI
jgi:hypothetical protein